MIDELVGDSACADGLHKECLREGLKGRVVVFRKCIVTIGRLAFQSSPARSCPQSAQS